MRENSDVGGTCVAGAGCAHARVCAGDSGENGSYYPV